MVTKIARNLWRVASKQNYNELEAGSWKTLQRTKNLKLLNPNAKVNFFLFALVIFEIFILINSVTAQSYQISEADKEITQEIVKDKDSLAKNILISLFAIKELGVVSAISFNTSYNTTNYAAGDYSLVDVNWNCCVETNDGAICQDVASTVSENYCSDALPTKCDNTKECAVGCCYDPEQGLCSTKSTKYVCEENGGLWADEENCLVEECEKGCCILGSQVEYTTERRCELLSLIRGYEKDFKDSLNELACIVLESIQEDGACILTGNACVMTTQIDCVEKTGTFYSGSLCSNPLLNTSCEKQSSVGCSEGDSEIYWFDSCGNKENIYSSDKDASWNNGLILSKSESCNSGSNNVDSETCGNCNYVLGSDCKQTNSSKHIEDGDYVCQSLTCIDETGKVRQNGESWCVYDGVIGEGKDVIGSRHWKRICNEGTIEVEPCADYRGQICAQSQVTGDSKTITQANCVVNEAINCVNYNQKNNMESLCEKNPDCQLKGVDIDEGFKFNICTPNYPKGFDLSYESGRDSAQALCGMASQECVVMYEKKITGWECVFNCDCEEQTFTDTMNEICTSMGDCGAYVNIAGRGTDSYELEENDYKVSWGDYSGNAVSKAGQAAKTKDVSTSMGMISGSSEVYDNSSSGTEGLADTNTAINYASTITGATGTVITALAGTSPFLGWIGNGLGTSAYLVGSPAFEVPILYGGTQTMPATEGLIGAGGQLTGVIGGAVQVIGSVGFAMGVGSVAAMVANWVFGLSGDAALITTLVGAGAGLAVGIAASVATSALSGTAFGATLGLTATSGLAGCMASLIFAAICAVIVIVIVVICALIMKLLGIGDTEEIHVKFTCLPWQAPSGGSDCSLCNDDPLKPCSEYRCQSLGKACELINDDTENPICVASVDDGAAPKIELTEISSGYKFTKENSNQYKIRQEDGSCIREFSSVMMNFETSEYAQCKFDIKATAGYENMSKYLSEGNMYTLNHTLGYMMPSLSSLEVYNLSGDLINQIAETDLYLRCIDDYGNSNAKEILLDFCLTDGPDLTPPYIVKADPINKAYLKRGITEVPLTIYLNEPATCKLDNVDRDYEIMQGEMDCAENLTDMTIYGWACNITLTDLIKSENDIYIRCKDQPWLEGNENETENRTRNVNAESTEYILYASDGELSIDSVTPKNGTLESYGFAPVSVDLVVETSGGFDSSGDAICEYTFNGANIPSQFYETGQNVHKQNFNNIMGGKYNIFVKCEDDAGNVANATTSFEINVDNNPPQIINLYSEENTIHIITDEDSTCYYTLDKCDFEVENATEINSLETKEHSFESTEDIKYYVKCKDKWNNKNTYCATIVSVSDL